MTRHLTHALATLYALCAIALIPCAMTSHRAGADHHAAAFLAASMLLAVGIVHHAYHHDTLRRLERAARPPGPHDAAIADEIACGLTALAEACCLPAAVSAGADHDPQQCTRKDHTT